jgi:hypothetical protein
LDLHRYTGDQTPNKEAIADIEQRVAAMHIEATVVERNIPLDLHQLPQYPVLQCDMKRANEYKRLAAKTSKSDLNKESLARREENAKNNFVMHAKEATRRLSRAFKLAKIPLILAAGTLLGWYRECSIIAHTEDLDFGVIADHIVSMEHLRLLLVCRSD